MLVRMAPHQFLLLQRQNGLENRADKFHPLTLRAILSAWFPRSPWEREAQDALRHRSVPTREPAWPALRDPERRNRTGRRGNELTGGKFHPLTLQAIRRNILPSPAPNSATRGGGLLSFTQNQAAFQSRCPPWRSSYASSKVLGKISNSLDTALLRPKAK
jgi:hypothetical protein